MVEKQIQKKANETLEEIIKFVATIMELTKEYNQEAKLEHLTPQIEEHCNQIIQKIDAVLKKEQIVEKEEKEIKEKEKKEDKKVEKINESIITKFEKILKHIEGHEDLFKNIQKNLELIRKGFVSLQKDIKNEFAYIPSILNLDKNNPISENKKEEVKAKAKERLKTVINKLIKDSEKILDYVKRFERRNQAELRDLIQSLNNEQIDFEKVLKYLDEYKQYLIIKMGKNKLVEINNIINPINNHLTQAWDKINPITEIIVKNERIFMKIIDNTIKDIDELTKKLNSTIKNTRIDTNEIAYLDKIRKNLDKRIQNYFNSTFRNKELQRDMTLYNVSGNVHKGIENIEIAKDLIKKCIEKIEQIEKEDIIKLKQSKPENISKANAA
jgi:hypothetical protein